MPTYECRAPAGLLDAARRARIAAAVTRIHRQVTGASAYFAQVIFTEVADGAWFLGGTPLVGPHLFLHGHIRAGRSAGDRMRLIRRLVAALAEGASLPPRSVWVYVTELPPRAMAEYGHTLPEPGDEAAWFAALPPEDQAHLRALGAGDAGDAGDDGAGPGTAN
ncbi:tautomerase family protein [Acidisphaera rubrifaciens]|uniref:4-oxalocrotonate tautomerase n=1 Tax=Acidisphaera rubrifaciens HS-AP3 TaxID=1231350 RepID=A0A0D6P3I9_9PROT|nr:tautomerase family protein [Acidisphaera rubrifaciens]GAN76325.1 4-oxalocrotonate tautomerase [Acidisphaera rubrifaciens HS-AP3]